MLANFKKRHPQYTIKSYEMLIMSLICLVKFDHIFHIAQIHLAEIITIPQALLSTGEIRNTRLDYSRLWSEETLE